MGEVCAIRQQARIGQVIIVSRLRQRNEHATMALAQTGNGGWCLSESTEMAARIDGRARHGNVRLPAASAWCVLCGALLTLDWPCSVEWGSFVLRGLMGDMEHAALGDAYRRSA